MPELKPCPFCGSEANISEYKDMDFLIHNADCFMVICKSPDCGCGTSYEPTKEAAIAVWNKRMGVKQ